MSDAPLKGMPRWPGLGSLFSGRPRLSLRFFTWLSVNLGIEGARCENEHYFSQLEARCIRLESILDAMQVGKLKFYADRQPSTQPTRVMDYESSQIAALDEFKEQ